MYRPTYLLKPSMLLDTNEIVFKIPLIKSRLSDDGSPIEMRDSVVLLFLTTALVHRRTPKLLIQSYQVRVPVIAIVFINLVRI